MPSTRAWLRRRAGQAGYLEAEDGSDLAQTDSADQVLEPAAVVRGAPRQAQIRVDHLHLGPGPPEADRLVGQRILAGGRLGVVADLGQAGLANVDDPCPRKVAGGDLLRAPHHWPPMPRPPCWPAPPPPLSKGPLRPTRPGTAIRC